MCSKPNARKRTIKTKIAGFEQVMTKTCMKSILKRKKLEASKPNYY